MPERDAAQEAIYLVTPHGRLALMGPAPARSPSAEEKKND